MGASESSDGEDGARTDFGRPTPLEPAEGEKAFLAKGLLRTDMAWLYVKLGGCHESTRVVEEVSYRRKKCRSSAVLIGCSGPSAVM